MAQEAHTHLLNLPLLQAEAACRQACSMGTLLPNMLYHMQRGLHANLNSLDSGPHRFHHVWSVLLFALCTSIHVKSAGPHTPG